MTKKSIVILDTGGVSYFTAFVSDQLSGMAELYWGPLPL